MRNSLYMVVVALIVGNSFGVHGGQLGYDYYKYSCPLLEDTVKKEMIAIFATDISAPAAFLRLFFHDCQGCDASILLDSHDLTTHNTELVSSKNFGIRKQELISHIKSVLELECPGQVSCADIIALAAKESVLFTGGPHITIPLGRKDSTTATNSKQADLNLPSPGITVDQLLHIFTSKGMNLEESVAILGAHTLGVGHCVNIVNRLYNRKPSDRMDFVFEQMLRLKCPTRVPLTNLTIVSNDLTPFVFDNQYYTNVLMGKGLFGIDSSISTDPRTLPIVRRFAADQNYFFNVFSSAFVKLSSTNVLTQRQGEVRRQCNRIN
ncbi:hypothetical protein FEM48_Zijuj01G0121800 [Ziziphus jujuba var. spinosa]|uniref:Peroxidase n=1 Tax=Ziziphus jujuba var. spinosa TaxID=714518 RepID=A0A978W168_ZIZJJ|nr:hypothetical protein FEM48_Zijuj01G0121800 [Ziziphus jujuba var. spinosa]